jgi:hypothetical protein
LRSFGGLTSQAFAIVCHFSQFAFHHLPKGFHDIVAAAVNLAVTFEAGSRLSLIGSPVFSDCESLWSLCIPCSMTELW